jgi:tetratricopeptide (TPR) repeat protein
MKHKFLLTSLVCLGYLSTVSLVLADTIKLKDGRVIHCDYAKEDGKVLRYWVGEASLTISLDKVESIEKDNIKGEALVTNPNAERTIESSKETSKTPADDSSKNKLIQFQIPIIRVNGVSLDLKATDELEAKLKNNPSDKELINILVTSLNAIAFAEDQAGHKTKAKELLERSLKWQPNNSNALMLLSKNEIDTGHYNEAVRQARKAVEADPKNQFAHYLLGQGYYLLENLQDAVNAWQTALKLGENALIREDLTKAKNELARAKDFTSSRSRFFNIVIEGDSLNNGLESQLLVVLENKYDTLRRSFSYEPKERISAIFYTKSTFSDITQAPSWAGALNDGKLRVPIGGVSSVDDELTRTITHELTHSFVYFKAQGKCPVWLNEGIAQVMEGKSANVYHTQLAALIAGNPQFGLKVLSGSFTGFSTAQALVAYAYSLAAVEMLSQRGISTLMDILGDLSQNYTIDQALSRHTSYKDLAEFDGELKKRLKP